MEIKVQKRDGSLQDFDRSKVVNGVVKAGGSLDEAESVAGQVISWAQTSAENGVVKSTDIKMKVLDVLQSTNPAIADKFRDYQKTPQV